MIIIPREKPVVENLNSYYLDIRKLLEHYQGELGSGGIHFKSPFSEAVIFFDKDDILASIFQGKDETQKGEEAIEGLVEATAESNFAVNIYRIASDKIFFWANLFDAEEVHKDLSTEFTDLEGLANKMSSERLTGYIDVSIGNGDEEGLIFFVNGEIIGGSYSWGRGELNRSKESLELLIRKSKESGGVFNVSRIAAPRTEAPARSKPSGGKLSHNVLTMLEGLLLILERMVGSNKKIKADFSTLLKRKLVEKADEYSFLDPFTGEFEYSDKKITFTGNAEDEDMAKGLVECVKELADELGILSELKDNLSSWTRKYERNLAEFGISF